MMLVLEKDSAAVYRCVVSGDTELILTPYPTQSILAQAYLKVEAGGLLPVVFHEGVPDLAWFLARFSKEPTLACWAKVSYNTSFNLNYQLAGLTWFNSITRVGGTDQRKAETGLFFFREFQHHGWTAIWSHMSTEWAFENLGIDAIFGLTPAPNRAAVRFVRSLGWNLYGPVPGYTSYDEKPCDAWLSAMTKSRWALLRDTIFKKEEPSMPV